jgi:predicted MFS family arabinose efflux permease
MLIISPLGGVAADRLDKRFLIVTSQLMLGVLSLITVLLVLFDVTEVWHLVAIGIVHGITVPFNMPARQAAIPELVGRERMPNAIALHSTGRNMNRVAAPALAGLLLTWDPFIAFAAITVFHVAAGVTITGLPSGMKAASKSLGASAELLTGFRYIKSNPALMTLLLMALLPILFGMPFQYFLPVFQAEVLFVDPSRLGLLYTALGIGALTGSFILAYIADTPHKGLLQLLSGIAFGVTLVFFALSNSYWLSFLMLLAVGMSSQAYLTLNQTLLMMSTDRALYGRVMSVYMMTRSAMPISTLPMGFLVDWWGPQGTIAGAGVILAVSLAIVGVLRPAQWRATKKEEVPIGTG